MDREYQIIASVYAAKENTQNADRLIEQYLPFIKSETAKFIYRMPLEGRDDELSIAMMAFHESVLAYEKGKGAFLPFASRAIRNRLIDFSRREKRHENQTSLDQQAGDDSERTLMETLDTGNNPIEEYNLREATREEILEFSRTLQSYGLSLTDIADNCPKQQRTLAACKQALAYARANRKILDTLVSTKKLPVTALVEGAKIPHKTVERHRRYIMAIFLAYTNGFEIIRGHLNQIYIMKGGTD